MGGTTSKTSSNNDDKNTTEQASGVCQHSKVKIMQNVVLIWLDKNSDSKDNVDYQKISTELQCVVNTVFSFTDIDQCIHFIDSITDNNVCMIVSGSLGEQIVPRIHDRSQLHSILIFCSNRKWHEKWAQDWFKVKGVFMEYIPMLVTVQKIVQQCENNSIGISFIATNGDMPIQDLNQIDPSFIYSQILKEIIPTMKFEQTHIKAFMNYCSKQLAENERGPKKTINEFDKNYKDKTPISWYTNECFLYSILNRALRTMDMDIIIRMGFFIGDLHRQIEQLHSEQFNGHHTGAAFTVYRGQCMTKIDFEQIEKANDGFISFNNFLLTSKRKEVFTKFAGDAVKNSELVGVLFVMKIDPAKSKIPFASITDVSGHKNKENELLFSMNTVFRIHGVKAMVENTRFFEVHLALTSDNDKVLRSLTDCIREQTFPEKEGWDRLGYLFFKMNRPDKAEQICKVLLEQATDEREKASIYHQLGLLKVHQNQFEDAMIYYEQALQINQKTLPPNHSDLATSYNNIGTVYDKMGEHLKALSFYQKALIIMEKYLPPNHPDLASAYDNMGLNYYNMSEYSQALSHLEKALNIKQKILPPNHPDLPSFYNNIGFVYDSMGQYQKALSYVEKALEIKQNTLPSLHSDLGACYNFIGEVYFKMNEYLTARSFYERAVDNAQHSSPPNPSILQLYKNNLDKVNKKS